MQDWKDIRKGGICYAFFKGVNFKQHGMLMLMAKSHLQSLNGHQGRSKNKYFDQNRSQIIFWAKFEFFGQNLPIQGLDILAIHKMQAS